MSTNDVVNIKSAYEKMLEDGSAFQKVDMRMGDQPNLEGLGEEIKQEPAKKHPSLEEQPQGLQEDDTDFSDIDRRMSERMNSLRNKVRGVPSSPQQTLGGQKELLALKVRVAKLEEALILVMETHEKLLG